MAKQKLNWTILLYRLLPSLTNFMLFSNVLLTNLAIQ